MNVERNFSYADQVRRAIKRGISRKDMPYALGLTRRQITMTIRRLRIQGELAANNFSLEREARRDGVSDSRGGMFFLIKPYADLGMTPLEAYYALIFEKGPIVNKTQVINAVRHARYRGNTRHLSEEEKRDSVRSANCSKSQLKRKVLLWLDSVRVARIMEMEFQNMDRLEWNSWVDKCLAEGYITTKGIDARIRASEVSQNK